MPGLVGKVTRVTGASWGIGRAIAIRLGREVASVVVKSAGNVEAARQTVDAVEGAGGKAIAVQADVGLGQIKAPLVAIDFEDDLINPPRVGDPGARDRPPGAWQGDRHPRGDRTRGHGTHTLAAVWKEHLISLLSESGR